MASNSGLVHTSSSAPSDTDQLWVDTSVTPILLKHYDANNSQWVATCELFNMTNNSGQATIAGHVVIIDTTADNSFKFTSTAADTKFAGITPAAISNGSNGVVLNRGFGIPVRMENSATAGSFLRTSSATGKAEAVGSFGQGVWGILHTSASANNNGSCLIFGGMGGGVNASDNVTWTGTHTFNSTITINTASATTVNWFPIVQRIYGYETATSTANTTTPIDDTVPAAAEGTTFVSASITPKNSNNRLIIEALFAGSRAGTSILVGFLTQDAGASIASVGEQAGNNEPITFPIRHEMSAGTTAATTFRARIGTESGEVVTQNGRNSAGLFGGTMRSSIRITEIKV